MSQDFLFADEPRTLVEDAEGGIRYLPGVVDVARATRWFDALRESVDWHAERRPMYDRVVDVPRLTGGYSLDDPALPPALEEAARVVRDAVGVEFTHVGLNHYRDGRDSVAPHNDKLHSIVPGYPIALLSLGATRRMDIRGKEPSVPGGKRRAWRIELEAGSLLVMSHDSQRHFDHGIPKVAVPVGPRISCAFRVRPGSGRW
ncbi:MAG TPA: alpha-ketoglutarate-dependent dioxygenase AlkB [Luteimonas sp.]|jgi:alkylated DNA repair dioxygenase AlkB|nr:alpha-ketoglutarate-dependent dioxygenase AlkB [Luteimonas sp.]